MRDIQWPHQTLIQNSKSRKKKNTRLYLNKNMWGLRPRAPRGGSSVRRAHAPVGRWLRSLLSTSLTKRPSETLSYGNKISGTVVRKCLQRTPDDPTYMRNARVRLIETIERGCQGLLSKGLKNYFQFFFPERKNVLGWATVSLEFWVGGATMQRLPWVLPPRGWWLKFWWYAFILSYQFLCLVHHDNGHIC